MCDDNNERRKLTLLQLLLDRKSMQHHLSLASLQRSLFANEALGRRHERTLCKKTRRYSLAEKRRHCAAVNTAWKHSDTKRPSKKYSQPARLGIAKCIDAV